MKRAALERKSKRFVYVAEFVCGLLKIGCSKHPEKRKTELRRDAPVPCAGIVRWWVSEPVFWSSSVEKTLIDAYADRRVVPESREWFRGVSFEDACYRAVMARAEEMARPAYEVPTQDLLNLRLYRALMRRNLERA